MVSSQMLRNLLFGAGGIILALIAAGCSGNQMFNTLNASRLLFSDRFLTSSFRPEFIRH